MKKFFHSGLLAVVAGLFIGCSATQGYSGARRGADEVSTIYFFSSLPVQTDGLSVDDVEQKIFDMGVEVLPGQHKIELLYQIKDKDCAGWYNTCMDFIYRGRCTATIESKAGTDYAMRLVTLGDAVSARVEDRKTGESVANAECKRGGSSVRNGYQSN